jgi:hypothetical protein
MMKCNHCNETMREVYSDAMKEPIGRVCINPKCDEIKARRDVDTFIEQFLADETI